MIEEIISLNETSKSISGQELLGSGSRSNNGMISVQCTIEGLTDAQIEQAVYKVFFEGGINNLNGVKFSNIITFDNKQEEGATLTIIEISQNCSYRFRAVEGNYNFRVSAKS